MKSVSERIIITTSIFTFAFLGAYLSFLTFGEFAAGSSYQNLISTMVILGGVLSISLFAVILLVDSFYYKRGYS